MSFEEYRGKNVRQKIHTSFERAHEVQPDINASVAFFDETEQIKKLDNLSSNAPMYGIPVVLKDNVSVKGLPTTASSGILQGYVPVFNAHVTDLLEKAGCVFVAKSSMDEFAMGGTNLNAYTGPVRNPYDISRVSGGSSGGSAALVASGAVPAAIGSDTGDSVRRPASYCGVVGIKPSYGRISRYGMIPFASSLDHVGIFTQNVTDAAALLEVVSGRDDRDMTSSFRKVPEYEKMCTGDIRGKTVAVFGNVYDEITDMRIKEAMDRMVREMEKRGASVVFRRMDEKIAKCIWPVYYIISNAEASSNHMNLDGIRFGQSGGGDTYEEISRSSRSKGMSLFVRKRFMIGAYGISEENRKEIFEKAQKVRRIIEEEYHRMTEGTDALIAPACLHAAPLMEEAVQEITDFSVSNHHMILTNFSGDPSMSVPWISLDGMPLGLLISGNMFDEAGMLNIAKAAEEIAGWKNTARETLL